MNKIFAGLCISFLIISGEAGAQIIGGSVNTTASVETAASEDDARLVSKEEIEALIAAEPPAAAMTPEQKAEIDSVAKKNMRHSIKKQSVRERKDFIDAMNNVEKIKKRREALLSGQDETAAKQAEDEVEKPDFNPAQDSAMENYLLEKANLAEPPFINEPAVSDVR